MIVVIFESWPHPGRGSEYLDHGVKMSHLLEGFDGFISIERFESVVEPGKFVALSYWRDEAAVDAFRQIPTHRGIQKQSRREIFTDYQIRVAAVIRDYTKNNRVQAPVDSSVNVQ